MEGSDGVILLEWPTPARQLGDPMKTWMSPPGPSVGTSVLGCRRVSLSADVSQETPGECYSRDGNEQGEVGACHAHGESIGASHMAGDRLDDSQRCPFERKADGRMAEVPPRQRVAVDTPCICLLYTSPSPRDLSTSRMPSSA